MVRSVFMDIRSLHCFQKFTGYISIKIVYNIVKKSEEVSQHKAMLSSLLMLAITEARQLPGAELGSGAESWELQVTLTLATFGQKLT